MPFFPDDLYNVLLERIELGDPKKSYTKRLAEAGPPVLIRKLVEEAGEVAGALAAQDKEHLAEEVADLWYHSLVILAYMDIDPDQVSECLKQRHQKKNR